ncbi:hypothetical protein IKF28_01020 [Candidatus Saccharibacteria bacterium]|nr:hypothetical protein [Candidatus Saccharibacteria bacterium]
MTTKENSDFNKIMSRVEDVMDDLVALQNRTDDGINFVQCVSYAELDDIINRLDALEEDAFNFFELNSERYKMMTNKILSIRTEVTNARRLKDYTSDR